MSVSSSTLSADSLALLLRYQTQQDQVAFAKLVGAHAGWMATVAARVTGRNADAADVVQDAFALLIRKAPTFPSAMALVAWLHRTVLFTARNVMKKETHRQRLLARSALETLSSEPAAFPVEALRALDDVLDELPEMDRQIIAARYLQNQSWDMIAQQRGRTPDAVRKQCERLLQRLADKLRRRGIVTAMGIGATLANSSGAPIPTALTDTWAAVALQKAPLLGPLALGSHSLATVSLAYLGGSAALLFLMVGGVKFLTIQPAIPPLAAIHTAPIASALSAWKPADPLDANDFERWLTEDLTAALAWAHGRPTTIKREQAFATQCGLKLSNGDLSSVLAIIQAMAPSVLRANLQVTYVQKLAVTDIAAAVQYAKSMQGVARLRALQDLAASIVERDPATVLGLVGEGLLRDLGDSDLVKNTYFRDNRMTGGGRNDGILTIMAIIQSLAQQNPQAFFSSLTKQPAELWNSHGQVATSINESFDQWFSKDPNAAHAWCNAHSHLPRVANAKQAWEIKQDPLNWLADWHPDLSDKSPSALLVGQDLARHIPLKLLPEFIKKCRALFRGDDSAPEVIAFRRLTEEAPDQAVKFMAEKDFPSSLNSLTQAAFSKITKQGLPVAINAWNALPPARKQSLDLGRIVQELLESEPQGTSEWVNQMPASAAKDNAIQGLIQHLTASNSPADYEDAVMWTQACSSTSVREMNLSRIGNAWRSSSVDYNNSVNNSQLAPELKAKLLSND
jgi:RNA polymerase sigma-70 factor (ECF subfamily)